MGTETALRTPLCQLFDIRYPIVQAGMGAGIAGPDLVAAVSNAGGLGVLGAHLMPPDRLRTAIREIKSSTDQPFGVNLIVAPPETGNDDVATAQRALDGFREELELPAGDPGMSLPPSILADAFAVTLEESVPVLSMGLGDPSRFIGPAHERGMRVLVMVATVEEAVSAAGAGADAIAAQGFEAGGHRSNFSAPYGEEVPMVGTFALVPQVVDAVDVPVLAAGGVMDGRGLAAALALGAEGALMGTRFLLARESGAFAAYRRALIAATEVDTLVTSAPTGRPARSIRNRLVDELAGDYAPLPYPLQGAAAMDIYMAALQADAADLFPLWAGQGLRLATREKPAAEIVSEIVTEAAAILTGYPGVEFSSTETATPSQGARRRPAAMPGTARRPRRW